MMIAAPSSVHALLLPSLRQTPSSLLVFVVSIRARHHLVTVSLWVEQPHFHPLTVMICFSNIIFPSPPAPPSHHQHQPSSASTITSISVLDVLPSSLLLQAVLRITSTTLAVVIASTSTSIFSSRSRQHRLHHLLAISSLLIYRQHQPQFCSYDRCYLGELLSL